MSITSKSWKLAAPHNARTQGLVVSGFGTLPTGRALFLAFGWPDDQPRRGAWLSSLQAIAPVTDAAGPTARAVSLAFTHAGLARMGLSSVSLDSFAAPFREGMMQEDRLRRLGDRRDGEWQGTVIAGGPIWSANTPQRGAMESAAHVPADALTATGHREEPISTAITVHALLQLFDANEDSAETWTAAVEAALLPHGVTIVRQLPLELRLDANGIGREHFGFADGVSQPIPFDDAAIVASERDTWNGIPLGDVLLGYTNSHHETAATPAAPPLASVIPELEPHPLTEGQLDFGRNGSYLVVRELKQDVGAFWRSLQAAAERIRLRDPLHSSHVTTDWVAERVVGRDKDGHLLCPVGSLAPFDNQPRNDFGFFDADQHGYGCPVGSHVRRANPRDGLAPDASSKQALLDAANSHRILRRGRKYGPTSLEPFQDDGLDRGLLFICLNTDIARQFEFVQQTWLLNTNFATLYDETDPLLGPKGHMTIREKPLRRRVEVDTFVQMVGGDYFFLPSLPALRYLAQL